MVATLRQEVEIRDPMWSFLQSIVNPTGPKRVREVVIEGPRGTSKTRSMLQIAAALGTIYPKLSILLCRKTRESMTGSVLVEFEKCWPEGHKILDGARPEQRSIYRHPVTGTTYSALGLNEVERLRSRSDDIVIMDEASEGSLATWESFRGLVRNWALPQQQLIIGLTNPKHPGHYLNQLCLSGKAERIKTTLKCNPKYAFADGEWTPEGLAYKQSLEKMSGVRYKRDFLGLWCAAEGLVFDNYEPETSLIDGKIEERSGQHWLIVEGWPEPVFIDWFFVSMDFGTRAPGCLQVWGVEQDRQRLYRVAEVYQPLWLLDEWARVLVELRREFPFSRGVGDCADLQALMFLNDRLGAPRGRELKRIIYPADKSSGKLHGIDQLKWGFARTDGGPRTYLLRNATRYGRPSELLAQGRPTSLEEELLEFAWEEVKPEDFAAVAKERPDAQAADHAIDAAIYAHVFAWRKDLRTRSKRPQYKPGTLGSQLRLNGKEIKWPRPQLN